MRRTCVIINFFNFINPVNKTPKILHVSTPKSWRGGEQQIAYLYEELAQIGIEQYILCAKGGELAKRGKAKKWNIIESRKRAAIDPFFSFSIKRISRLKNIDIIHVHDSHAHTFAMISSSIWRNNIPIVVSRRVDFPISNSSIKKYNHKNIKRILCVSDAIKAITATKIVDQSILKTIYSGIDLERFHSVNQPMDVLRTEFNIAANIPLIGNVAAIAPHKDYFTFIDTAEEVIKRGLNAKFIIIGTGPLELEIKEYCLMKGLSDHIIFTGFRSDIPTILPELDLFLITSETEGLGTSVIDAFACRVPVVATRAGGIPELVHHEKTGLLADIKDPVGHANQIELILNSASLQAQIIKGQQEILPLFTKTETAKKTLQEYLAVLEQEQPNHYD